ncbi:MAG: DivIVA domain-containing protein [Ruminococcus sp.]|nr:DivIVA domain-containing protein [Ruminococcus sp.]
MLTIDEIKNISFRKATLNGGYRAEDVNAFIDEVIATFEQLKKEKTNLVHKIDVLATRVEQYRADEETVRNALLASQKVSDACIKEAKDKAAKIVRDAERKAQILVADANKMTAKEKENYLQLQADAVNLRSELIELYKAHIQSISDLPTVQDYEKVEAEVEEKYPTDDVDVQVYEPEVDADETELNTVEVNKSESVDDVVSEPVHPRTVSTKRASKFAHLKFGDNYDVSAE